MEPEDQGPTPRDRRHRGNASPFSRHLLFRRLTARSPCLSQQGCQGNVRFVLEIKDCVVLSHRTANLREQNPELRIDYLDQSACCPQVGFVSVVGCRRQHDLPQPLSVKAFEFSRTAISFCAQQARFAPRLKAGNPAMDRRAIGSISLCHNRNGQLLIKHRADSAKSNVVGRMDRSAHGGRVVAEMSFSVNISVALFLERAIPESKAPSGLVVVCGSVDLASAFPASVGTQQGIVGMPLRRM